MPVQSQGPRRNSFMGVLTLAAANTPYRILDLVNTIIQAEGGAAATQTCTEAARFFFISAYQGVDGAGLNTNDVVLGEVIGLAPNLVTSARFGYVLAKSGANLTLQGTISNLDLGNYWVQSAGTNQKISVIIAGA